MATPLWSEEDIAKLRAAIVALASGEKVQSVTYAGPPSRQVVYHATDLAEMRSLLTEMVREVRPAVVSSRRAAFSKGFGGPARCGWRRNE